MEKLDWMPLYIDDLLSSPAWMDMRDYQRGWYFQLLLRCTRSEPLGYLKLDGNLWRIAGAHNRPMWDNHKVEVMACFKSCQIDGIAMIYNERLLSVMEKQSGKYRLKKPVYISPDNIDVDFDLKEEKERPKATRIPEYFVPKDGHYSIAAELGINCEMEFQKFRDYYLGMSGSKAVKLDWDATLRNWLRNSVNFGGRSSGQEPSKTKQRISENRRNILIGLGISQNAGPVRSGNGAGSPTGGDPTMVRDFQGRESSDSGTSIPPILEARKVLPKAR